MPTLVQLWLPILLSGALVFIASAVIHMVIKYHNADYGRLANEEEVRAALRKGAPRPGQYVFPHGLDPKDAKNPETARRFAEGPVGLLWLRQNGFPNMGKLLGTWFLYCVGIALLVAYVATIVLPKGAQFATVMRVLSAVAFLGFAGAKPADTIWMGKPGSALAKDLVDGVVYALVTGAVFAWLWPR